MTVCWSADYVFPQGSVGVTLAFVVTVPDGAGSSVLLSHAGSAVVTWVSPDGTQRVLSSVNPDSATFQWVTNSSDFPTPRTEIGRNKISTISGGIFWSSAFVVQVTPRF